MNRANQDRNEKSRANALMSHRRDPLLRFFLVPIEGRFHQVADPEPLFFHVLQTISRPRVSRAI
ncbi:hypothetical protein SJ05684_b53380 (plasmid) [Sinorhizobium sojae CCBAU 05684]|uniref:Uncharacterized protein n=1 Tax=Sinorhizobium sojae CCBAU 05684 TaxID=716928 RepID=A0A249PK48_9HYPH|nr:hypothetical protein SJ05684_b53380 [Sinorhizobium sojae CCBAU 05684]